jgi:hypothetical protein
MRSGQNKGDAGIRSRLRGKGMGGLDEVKKENSENGK